MLYLGNGLSRYVLIYNQEVSFTDRMQGHLHTSSGIERFVLLSCFFAVYTGAPNENIVQNHLNIELLNVF